MQEIRRLQQDEFAEFARIVVNAYPGMQIRGQEAVERYGQRLMSSQQKDPTVAFYGCFRDGLLVGGMRLHDFTIQLLSQRVQAGGVGQIAVDLAHKKEKVCRDMMLWYLHYYRQQGVSMAMLYPFRPDFYKQMGFGFGTKVHVYRVPPANLPAGSKEQVRFLGPEDRAQLAACYSRVQRQTNGLVDKTEAELDALFNGSKNCVGCVVDGRVTGYIVFDFQDKNSSGFLWNDMSVTEFFWEDTNALEQLCAFMRSQADQVRRVVFHTQDENFHHLFSDPRYGVEEVFFPVCQQSNISAVGLMYRVIDIGQLLASLQAHDFNGVTMQLKLTVRDLLLPENGGSRILDFQAGAVRELTADSHWQAELSLDIAEFSSLITGAVDLVSLCHYGRATLSDDKYLPLLNRLFAARNRPQCVTPF